MTDQDQAEQDRTEIQRLLARVERLPDDKRRLLVDILERTIHLAERTATDQNPNA